MTVATGGVVQRHREAAFDGEIASCGPRPTCGTSNLLYKDRPPPHGFPTELDKPSGGDCSRVEGPSALERSSVVSNQAAAPRTTSKPARRPQAVARNSYAKGTL